MHAGTRLDDSSRNEVEDDPEAGSTVFVKYNRMLHGRKTDRGRKRDTLTINFLKKYIHYAKNRMQPELTDEVMFLENLQMRYRVMTFNDNDIDILIFFFF